MAGTPTTPRKRGEGQWGLGYFEPLNPAERTKRDDDGLHVRARIEAKYSKQGFRSIDKADLRSRFRWWGLYTQRQAGHPRRADGDRRAARARGRVLHAADPDPGRAAHRPSSSGRSPGAASGTVATSPTSPTGRTCSCIGSGSRTSRASGRRSRSVGLSTQEACGDTPRVMLGCPLAGVDADEILDATPYLLETERRYVGDPSVLEPAAQVQDLDQRLPPAVRAARDQRRGVRRRRASGRHASASTCGSAAGSRRARTWRKRLGVFVDPELVPEVWAAVTGTFRDYGYRRARNHARLKFLVADKGPEWFREVMEKEYLGYALPDGEAPPSSPRRASRPRRRVPAEGRALLRRVRAEGRPDPRTPAAEGRRPRRPLRRRARPNDDAAEDGDPRRRAGVASTSWSTALEDEDLAVRPSPFRKGLMACTGIEFCKLALTETKGRAIWLARELEERLPDFDEDVRIHVNGCPNSCARFQIADIGLMGARAAAAGRHEERVVPRPPRRRARRGRIVRAQGARASACSRRTRPTTSRRCSSRYRHRQERARELQRVRPVALGRRSSPSSRGGTDERRDAARRSRSSARTAASRTCVRPATGRVALPGVRPPVRAGRSSAWVRRRGVQVNEREPIHEPALPVLDEEAAWVHEAAERFEDASAQELLAWALERFHPKMAISAAGGVDGMVILDMAWRIDPSVRVFTLDTGRLPAGDLHAVRGGPRALRHRGRVRVPRPARRRAPREAERPEPHVQERRPPRRLLRDPQGRTAEAQARDARRVGGRPSARAVEEPPEHREGRDSTATTAAS